MVNHGPTPHFHKDCPFMKGNNDQPCSIMVNDGPMSHCEKYCQYDKQPWPTTINDGQPWSKVTM